MAHNFKLTGERYISKSGHDSNDGLTPDTPKRSITDANIPNGAPTVIGAGHYIGGSLQGQHQRLNIVGDGKVILDSISVNINRYFYTGIHEANIEFRNMNIGVRECGLRKFIAKTCSLYGSVASASYGEAIILNSTLNMSSVFNTISQSVIVNTTGFLYYFNGNYVDKNTTLTLNSNSVAAIKYCNFRGVVKMNTTSNGYVSFAYKDLQVGTPQDNGYSAGVEWISEAKLTEVGYTGTIAGWDANIATCINRDPLFNNESLEDFTLQAGSPHIGRGLNGSNIGGTQTAYTTVNSGNGIGDVEVIVSPEINTTNPEFFVLKEGETEGYIDYIQKIASSPVTLGVIEPISLLNFNTDFVGGSLENNNVPDSEPTSTNYPRILITSSNAPDSLTLNIDGHNINIGEFVRVNGEDREVISTTMATVKVDAVFRAPVVSGIEVQIGEDHSIAALKPNRLTYLMRTSKMSTKPVLLSQWDNDADPIYNVGGQFLTQEWFTTPGYYINPTTNALYGSADARAPRGLSLNEISCMWIHLRVFIRNNYKI